MKSFASTNGARAASPPDLRRMKLMSANAPAALPVKYSASAWSRISSSLRKMGAGEVLLG